MAELSACRSPRRRRRTPQLDPVDPRIFVRIRNPVFEHYFRKSVFKHFFQYLQPEPEAADAMMDPAPAAAAAEESSDDEDGASDGAWASDGEDGSGSEEEAISD